jgi:hypothetical protein
MIQSLYLSVDARAIRRNRKMSRKSSSLSFGQHGAQNGLTLVDVSSGHFPDHLGFVSDGVRGHVVFGPLPAGYEIRCYFGTSGDVLLS